MEIKDIINVPVSNLGLGEEFESGCQKMGFRTLKNILEITPAKLIATKGFSYHWLGELINYLSKNKLLHYLQPVAGREKEDISLL